jgi:hypothetical protein
MRVIGSRESVRWTTEVELQERSDFPAVAFPATPIQQWKYWLGGSPPVIVFPAVARIANVKDEKALGKTGPVVGRLVRKRSSAVLT